MAYFPNSNNDPVSTLIVRKNTGANVGSRPRLNLVEGTNVTIAVVDDVINNEVDVIISSTGGQVSGILDPGANGLLSRTTLNTTAARTLTAGSNKIAVTQGDGVAGNPTIDVTEANLTLGNQGGTLGITKGGTGQTTALPAFNALSPLTTKGDLGGHSGTNNVRVPVGASNQMLLQVDSAQATGLAWTNTPYSKTTTTYARVGLQNDIRHWSISAYANDFSPNGGFIIADETAGAVRQSISTTGLITLNGSIVLGGLIEPAPATSQNDYNPTNLATSQTLILKPTASIFITGLQGGVTGREITIINGSTDYVVGLVHQSAASTAANRFIIGGKSVPTFLFPGDAAVFVYDGTSSRWRIKSLTNELDAEDDLLGTGGPFTTIISGTGASGQTGTYLTNATERPVGVFQVDTGTTNVGRAYLGSASSNSIVPRGGPALFLCRIAVEALSVALQRFQVFAGFHDGAAGVAVTDGIMWSYRDDVNAAWIRESVAASSPTRNASSTTVDTNYVWLGIFCNADWTRADYFISTDSVTWTFSGSNNATMPSTTQLVNIGVGINKTVGTTQANLSIDYLAYRYDSSRG